MKENNKSFKIMVKHQLDNSGILCFCITKHFFSLPFNNPLSEVVQPTLSCHVVMTASSTNVNYYMVT